MGTRVRSTDRLRVQPTSDATILHADLDSFYASVEQRDFPELRNRPIVVGGGVVLAASYEAKRRGVSAPMPEFKARRLCPDLVIVPPRFDAYTEASRAVFKIFDETSPIVEGISIDEAFIDVSGLRRIAGEPALIAAGLRHRVAAEVGLAITVGVARTKFLAKVASGVAKPDGLLVVPPDEELNFLHPLPVGRLWGVGAVTERALRERGIHTVGDVAQLDPQHLVSILGKASARQLYALAQNHDSRRVEVGKRRGSIGSQSALGRRRRSFDEVQAITLAIVDRVCRRLRAASRQGVTVTLRFRFDDFSRATRSHTLPHPTSSTDAIAGVATALLQQNRVMLDERGLTLVGLSVGGLSDAAQHAGQLGLPFTERGALDAAVDDLRARFGNATISRASSLGRQGFEVPKLPD